MEGLERDAGVCSALSGGEEAGEAEDSGACRRSEAQGRILAGGGGPGSRGSRHLNSALRPEARERPRASASAA